MKMRFEIISFALKAPFVITGYTFNTTDTVRVTLEADGFKGQGEGVGVYYLNDTAEVMMAQLADVASQVEAGLSFDAIQQMLPPGGARNALDCAFWDLEAKRSGVSVWERLKMTPKPLKTVCTVGIGSAEQMAATAAGYAKYPNLKIKLDGDNPVGKLEAIRAARSDASLVIDVNQGWTFEELKEYAPACEKLGIAMIEQPLKRGGDEELEGYTCPVPLGADESCLDASEYELAASRYDVINIKLDKCGGLSAGLLLANLALRFGDKFNKKGVRRKPYVNRGSEENDTETDGAICSADAGCGLCRPRSGRSEPGGGSCGGRGGEHRARRV